MFNKYNLRLKNVINSIKKKNVNTIKKILNEIDQHFKKQFKNRVSIEIKKLNK